MLKRIKRSRRFVGSALNLTVNTLVVYKAFAAGAVLAVASAAYLNLVKSAVAAVVVKLAVGNVASNSEIDVFH